MADDALAAGRRLDPAEYEALPWHADAWQRLMNARARLPHALLLQGQEGLGKDMFALRLARALLCAQVSAADACGQCHACRLIDAGNHPDLTRVTLEAERTAITVEQVRGLADFLALKPHSAAYKIVLLTPAELMNLNAANALLKLLEEPPLGSVFVLVSARPARLPATIRSRCAPIVFRPPPAAVTQPWLATRLGPAADAALAAAGGAPLLAMRLAQAEALSTMADVRRDLDAVAKGGDPIRVAAQWKSAGARPMMAAARRHLAESLRTQVVSLGAVKNSQYFIRLLSFIEVLDTRSQAGGPLDETLLLEEILIRWADMHTEPVVYTNS